MASARLLDIDGDVAGGAVLGALGAIGRAMSFDRITVLELTDARRVFSARVEWRAEGITRFAADPSDVPIDSFGWPLTELRDGHALSFGPRDIPEHARAARMVMERDGTRLLVTVPLIVGGDVTRR
jgi:hypothetical protein